MRQRNNGPAMLRKWRTDRDLRLKDVAKRFGVTVSAVSEWERGKRTPRLAMLLRFHKQGIVDIQEWAI